jgi:putative membrane protein
VLLWLKAFHIIFVVCWFAGLFYLPRILVHYAGSDNEQVRTHLAMMARKLYRFVTPFMVITVCLGIALIVQKPYLLEKGWLHVKLAGVAFLVAYHLLCGHYVKAAGENRIKHNHVYFRFFNEVPVLFLFGIVLLAVFQPF